MKITDDVRAYADKQGMEAAAALEQGMAEKSKEFVEAGAEIYRAE
jgi:phosphomethylpyrimidine synthase